jgi:thioredoxin reductase
VTEDSHGVRVAVGAQGQTAVPGVWATGNVANPAAQIVTAAAAGSATASAINNDLIIKDLTNTVTKYAAGTK